MAARFRRKYSSADVENAKANVVPYFIGVWDTVAALGLSWTRLIIIALVGIAAVAALAWVIHGILSITFISRFIEPPLAWHFFWYLIGIALFAGAIGYLVSHLKFATGLSRPWYKTVHFTGWRMKFYDRDLDPDVQFAQHALSIDENRKDFDRVQWTDHGQRKIDPDDPSPDWLEQIWFAGNHSDIGGSYAENESRLSDITLNWMIEHASRLPEPVLADPASLKLWPSCAGPQHDARKELLNSLPSWLLRILLLFRGPKKLGWIEGLRQIPTDAPLHPSVKDRFKLTSVLHYDETLAYRPEPLRYHDEVKGYY